MEPKQSQSTLNFKFYTLYIASIPLDYEIDHGSTMYVTGPQSYVQYVE